MVTFASLFHFFIFIFIEFFANNGHCYFFFSLHQKSGGERIANDEDFLHDFFVCFENRAE